LQVDKTRLLVNFGYHRKGWIYPFESLGDDFEIVYLYYIHKSQEVANHTTKRVIYWSDYANAIELLNDVAPHKVIFMDITSGVGIALNYAARQQKITTYIVQHGLYSSYHDYRNRLKIAAKQQSNNSEQESPQSYQSKPAFSTLRFFLSTVGWGRLYRMLAFPFYYVLMRQYGSLKASKMIRFKSRMPDYYLVYTQLNAQIHKELDRVKPEQLIPFGNLEFDDFLNRETSSTPLLDYFLLVDQPFADNRFGEHIVSREEKSKFLIKLNEYCKQQQKRLLVKLHPESYGSMWFPEDENITYVREHADLHHLIVNSVGCFGFFSTLMIPAAYLKPVLLFKVTYSIFTDAMEEMGMCRVLSYFDFTSDQIDFSPLENRDFPRFKESYLYKDDCQSLERLKLELKHGS